MRTASSASPEHKSQTKNRSAFENQAGPFPFRKKECRLAGHHFCAGIGANTQAVAEKWRVGKDANAFRETVEDSRDQTDRRLIVLPIRRRR